MTGKLPLSYLAWPLLAVGLIVLFAVLASPVLAQPPEPHQFIQEYEGPQTCEICHGGTTDDVIHTVHYTWDQKMDHYSPIAGTIARINWLGLLNEDLNIPGGCGRCHIGAGLMPKAPEEVTAEEVTAEDRAGIDCLICHSSTYDIGQRQVVQDEDGNWALTQDRSTLAARNAQRPDSENCLLCHFNVGGGPLLKRGVDFAPVSDKHGEASKGDVHADAGMVCVDCHSSQDHKIAGYGPTLWSRDLPDQRVACAACHTETPHQDQLINYNHTRLDCRACHITGTGGLIFRDWTAEPVYDPITELYAPVDDVQEPNAVSLDYRWYNGAPVLSEDDWPGARNDTNSKIQPFKVFKAVVPADAESGEPIPLQLGLFYTSGDLEQAIETGALQSEMDYSGSWEPKEVTEYLQTSHGVVGKGQTLYCQDCHVPDGVMDFAALGFLEEEVALLTSLSSASAGVRQPLRMQVDLPDPVPLPTPVNLSGDVEAASGRGIRIPFHPIAAVVVVLLIVGGAAFWLTRQRPSPGDSGNLV